VINKKVLESSKLEFIEYAAGEHRLGLDDETYDKVSELGYLFESDTRLTLFQLLTTVNVVIHNAWQLDFTLPLRDFEPHLSATRDLLDLVQASALEARLVFISSVGVAGRWSSPKGLVPEIVLEDPGVCLGLGYGESKYVAERVSMLLSLSS
jgi:nucleoside-diphosphate-sugar epimerase